MTLTISIFFISAFHLTNFELIIFADIKSINLSLAWVNVCFVSPHNDGSMSLLLHLTQIMVSVPSRHTD